MRIRLYALIILFLLSSSLLTSCGENKQQRASTKVLNVNKGQDLICYFVRGEELTESVVISKESKWKGFLRNRQEHQNYWNQVVEILLPEHVRGIEECIFSYEPKGDYSVFFQPLHECEKWAVNFNINRPKNQADFISALIHELGRMITMNKKQIDYYQKKGHCKNYYIDGYGCSVTDSYVNQFYQRFWKGAVTEWSSHKNKEVYFEKHLTDFVTAHAATGPVEDIIESFAHYMLSDKLTGHTLMAQKVNFFYEYPELVKMREQVLTRVIKFYSNGLDGDRH